MVSKDYIQPDFYHFSQDSVDLAKYVSSLNYGPTKVLDLFAGCGVVGIEFMQNSPSTKEIYFLEKEPEYFNFLEENCHKLNRSFHILKGDFEAFDFNEFDLIISNPPFYSLDEGRIPKCKQKRNCHFMSAQKLAKLMEKFSLAVNHSCEVYFLGRRDLFWIRPYISSNQISIVKELSKTSIFKVNKTG